MPTKNVTVIEADVWRVIKKDVKWLNWDSQRVKVEVKLDTNLIKKLDKDPLLQAKLWEAASDEYKEFVEASKTYFKKADKAIDKLYKKTDGYDYGWIRGDLDKVSGERDKVKDDLVSDMATLQEQLRTKVDKAVEGAWSKLKSKNKEYRDYKIKSVVSIGLRLTGVTFAAVGLFSNPITAGPGLLAIQSLVSGTLSSLQDCYKLAQSASGLRKSTDELMETLKKRFKSGMTQANLKDFTLANFKTVFGIDASNLGTAAKNIKQYEMKLIGVDQKSHDTAKKLNKALKEMEKLKKDYSEFDEPVFLSLITSLISDIHTLHDAVKDGKNWAKVTNETLAGIQSNKAVSLTVIEKLLGTGLAITKVGLDYAHMEKFCESAVKQAANGVKIANGLYHEYLKYEKQLKAMRKKMSSR